MWFLGGKAKHSWLIMLVDILLINGSIILAYLIKFKLTLPAFNFEPYREMFLWISLGSIFFLNLYHLYSVSARTRWDDQFYSIVLAVMLTLMLSISLTYISANYAFPRSVFLISGLLQIIFLTVWRWFLWKLTKRALGYQEAIMVGPLHELTELIHKIQEYSENHIKITGFITDEENCTEALECPKLGSLDDYEEILAKNKSDLVVITPSMDNGLKEKIVCFCYSNGLEVFLVPDLYEVLLTKADLSLIDDIPVFVVKDINGENNQLKRLLDLILGTVALILTIPVMIVIGIIIKLDSPGPAIYKQERVTKGGRTFVLYKFRTMVQDAESRSGPVFAVEDDQRATRVGKILRLSRLDELPQFVNVVKGDMSLVGPRPERPFFVEQFSKEIYGYDNRHRIKPGITGIAQIAGKYNTGPREKLVLDLLYAKQNNIMVDLRILFNTVKVLLMRDKAS